MEGAPPAVDEAPNAGGASPPDREGQSGAERERSRLEQSMRRREHRMAQRETERDTVKETERDRQRSPLAPPPPPPPTDAGSKDTDRLPLTEGGTPLQQVKARLGGRWVHMSAEQKRAALVSCEQIQSERDNERDRESSLPRIFELVQSPALSLEALYGGLTEPKTETERELGMVDRNGDTPLHLLCRNRNASAEMVRVLLERDTERQSAVARNKQGDTALSCLIAAARAEEREGEGETGRQRECRFRDHELLELGDDCRQVSVPSCGLPDNATVLANEALEVGATWELTILKGPEQLGGSSLSSALSPSAEILEVQLGATATSGHATDAGSPSSFSSSHSDSTVSESDVLDQKLPLVIGISTKSGPIGDLAQRDSHSDREADTSARVRVGDTARFEICANGEATVTLTGRDRETQRIRFTNVPTPLRPAVYFCGRGTGGWTIGVRQRETDSGSSVARLIATIAEMAPRALRVMDAAGRLPVQLVGQPGVLPAVKAAVIQASLATGVIWCGSPETEGQKEEQYGIHLLLHSLGSKADSKDARELDVRWCMDAMPKQPSVRDATRLHGLPFQSRDIRSAVCGLSHLVFLLKTGQIYRLPVYVMQKKSAKPAAELPERAELRECQAIVARHHEVLRRLKKAVEDAKKVDYGVDENEVQTLVEITAKSTDECRMVLRRIKPGLDRLELAMNILMGFAAMNAGSGSEYLLGDDVGRAQFELEQETRRLQPYERRLRDLTRIVNDHERRQKAAAQVYTVDSLVTVGSLQQWTDAPCSFSAIASMHSCLLALGEDGVLYAWSWSSTSRGVHQRAAALCAPGDPIVSVAASSLRASLLTEKGKVATWMDEICHVSGGGSALPDHGLDVLPPERERDRDEDEQQQQILQQLLCGDESRELTSCTVWKPEWLACHNDAGAWQVDQSVAELKGGRNYCIAVASVPFPTTGRHTCVVRICHAPENMAVGVVKSFADVSKHSHTSKGWIGNGPHGWCLFKDGDAAHNGSWKGGSYSQYAVSEGGTVGITFDADKRSVCFESNGRVRENIFTDLPAQVYLAVSLYKAGKVELVSSDFQLKAGSITTAASAQQGREMEPERLLFGEGAGVVINFSSEDRGRGVDNLRQTARRAESWVARGHGQEHVTVDFGSVASVSRVVLKPYYSKKYAVQYLCPTTHKWLDYQPWSEAEEGDDLPAFELNRVVETRQMKLLVDEGRKSSWKLLNIYGRSRHGGSVCTTWDPHIGPLALCELEHGATKFMGRDGEKIERIVVCDHGTVATTSSGRMYWWGCRPWRQRRAAMDAALGGSCGKFRRLFRTCVNMHAEDKKPVTAAEMLLCLGAPDDTFQEWIGEVGHDSEQAETLTKLRELYGLVLLEIQPGDVVVNCAVQQPIYSAGTKAIFSDRGTPTVVELVEDVPDLHADKATFKRCTGVSVQLDLHRMLFLSAENRSTRHRVLAVDRLRGIVVAQPLSEIFDATGLPPATEILDIVDIAPLSSIATEAVHQEPIQVFNKMQIVSDIDGRFGRRFDAAYQYYCDYAASTNLQVACSKESIFEMFVHAHAKAQAEVQERFHDANTDEGGNAGNTLQQDLDTDADDANSLGNDHFSSDVTGTDVADDLPSPASSATSYTSVNASPDIAAGDKETIAGHDPQGQIGLHQFAALVPAEVMSALKFSCPNLALQDVVIDEWRVIAAFWDGNALLRYVADLTTMEWKLDGVRLCDLAGAGPMLCVSDAESLMLEVDERGFLCSASAARLPRVDICAIGKVIAARLTVEHTVPTAVALMAVGFEQPESAAAEEFSSSPRCLGYGRRNALHSAAYSSETNVEDLLLQLQDDPESMAEMLIQRDCRGATPFFVAMEKQDLPGAVAIRHCARLVGVEEDALLPASFAGTPPLHALLGIGRGANVISLRKKLGSSLHLMNDLLADQSATRGTDIGTLLVQSRDSAGLTVFAAFVACSVRPEVCKDLAAAIVAVSPLAVAQCVSGPDHEVDEFVNALIECGSQECDLVCDALMDDGQDQFVLDAREDHRAPLECFVESCVRIYVSLFATPGAARDSYHDTLFHILASTVSFSVPLLAKLADDAVGAVRLGFPLGPLPRLALDQNVDPPKMNDTGHLPDYVEPVANDDRQRDAAEYVQACVTTVPNKSSSIWFWFYIPGSGAPNFDPSRLEFRYRRDSTGSWKTWSNPAVNAGDGWWHTPNWIRGSGTEWENSVWLDGELLLRDVREPADDNIDDPPQGNHPELRTPDLQHRKPAGGTGDSGQQQKKAGVEQDHKLARAMIFHLCVTTISMLMESHEEQRDMVCAEYGWVSDADLAMVTAMHDAAALLQTSWEHVYDVCGVLEARIMGQLNTQPQGRFGNFVASASGQSSEAPTVAEVSYVAYMLDALCRFKQALPDTPTAPPVFDLLGASAVVVPSSPSRPGDSSRELASPQLRRASSASAVLGSPERYSNASAGRGHRSLLGSPSSPGLVKSVSMMQRQSPASSRDAWSTRRRQQLLKGSGIDLSSNGGDGSRDSSSGPSSARSVMKRASQANERLIQRNLVSCSLLTALARWTKTMELMGSVPIDEDSMFAMIEPFEKKEERFRKRMAARVLALGQPKDDGAKLHMSIERGPSACDGVLRALISMRQRPCASQSDQPLCRPFEDKKPWFVGEMGEGKGPIREMILLVAQSVKSSSGGMAGLFKPSPALAGIALHSPDSSPWWKSTPFGRVVPTTAKEAVELDATTTARTAAAQAATHTKEIESNASGIPEGVPPVPAAGSGAVARVLFDEELAAAEVPLLLEPEPEPAPEPEPEPQEEPELEQELEPQPETQSESEPQPGALQPAAELELGAQQQPQFLAHIDIDERSYDSDGSDVEFEVEPLLDEEVDYELELEAEAAVKAAEAAAAAAATAAAVRTSSEKAPAQPELRTDDSAAVSNGSAIEAAFAAMLQSPRGVETGDAAAALASRLFGGTLSTATEAGWSSTAEVFHREELLSWMQHGMASEIAFMEASGGSDASASERVKKEVLLQAYAELAIASQGLQQIDTAARAAVPPHAAAAAAEQARASAASRPRVLSRQDCPRNVEIDGTECRARATAPTRDGSADGVGFPVLLRSTTPLTKALDGAIGYYEVTVVNAGGTANIVGVGLISPDQKAHRQPGWDRGAFGYHSDDGYLYAQQPSERAVQHKSEPYGTGDVVGCGVVFSRSTGLPAALFWTKNGQLLNMHVQLNLNPEPIPASDGPTTPRASIPVAADTLPAADLYAGIGLDKAGTEVEVNFGARPFLYDLDAHAEQAAALAAAAPARSTARVDAGTEQPDRSDQRLDLQAAEAPGLLHTFQVDDRLWRFRCLGNIMGLCLLHGGDQYDLRFPVFFSRHVYSFLLRRRVEFSDYAYHDPEAHANLLKILHAADLILAGQPVSDAGSQAVRVVAPDEDYWMLEWDESVGVGERCLGARGVSGAQTNVGDEGATLSQPVTAENAHAYVAQKAHYEMIASVRDELTALRDGLYDVISEEDVRSLTPDDLQLLLSGNGSAICYADFRKSVSFRDMRAESVRQSETGPARLRAFESSFWEALASMSEMELLKLAEFWTANVVALPAKPTAAATGQSAGIGGGMVVNLVDLEHNSKGGEVTMITARTCTNELTVPDYGVSGRELAQRLVRLLEAYEVLPQFDTI